MPEKTLEAFADHGEVEGDAVSGKADDAQQVFDTAGRRRHRLRRRAGRAREGGRREVREVLAGARRHHRGAARQGRVVTEPARAPPGTPSAGDRCRGHYELFFGYRDEAAFAAQVEQLVADRFASRLAAKDHTLWGQAAEEESAKRLGWVDLSHTSPAARRRDRRAPRRAARPGLDPRRALRHGRLVARARGDLRRRRRRARRARLLRPRLRAHGAIDNDLAHTVVVVSSQVRRHGRDRQPAPGLREGLRRRRHRPPRADRRRHRPGLPARPVRHARPATASSAPTPRWAAGSPR